MNCPGVKRRFADQSELQRRMRADWIDYSNLDML